MRVKILFFSVLRDLAGTDQRLLSIEKTGDVITLGEILVRLYGEIPALESWDSSLLLAVNAEFAAKDAEVRDGDEIALMPPVQGG